MIKIKEEKDEKMKKGSVKNFEEIIKPLHEVKKKIREDQAVDLIHKIRKEK